MDAKVRDVMTPGPIGVGAPVATPLSWPEVDDAGLEPGQFTMATIGARLAGTQDPWSGFTSTRHGLGEAGKRRARLER